jgi:hypothetical protein
MTMTSIVSILSILSILSIVSIVSIVSIMDQNHSIPYEFVEYLLVHLRKVTLMDLE